MTVTDFNHTGRPASSALPQTISTPADRVLALDVVRGVAVFGILVRNIFLFAMPTSAFALPTIWRSESFSNLASWLTVEVFFDGSMRAIFSMLFGASALIILGMWEGGSNDLANVERYYRRLLALIGLGFVHAYLLLWPNDVLLMYGVFGLFLFPLRNLSARTLLILGTSAFLLLAASQIHSSLEDVELPLADAQVLTHEQSQSDQQSGPMVVDDQPEVDVDDQVAEVLHGTWREEIELRQSGYMVNLREGVLLAIEQHTAELTKNHLIDIGGMLLIGMALFKLGFLTGQNSTKVYLCVMLIGYGLGVCLKIAPLSGWFQVLPAPLSGWDWGTINFDFSRLAIAMGHLSALMLFVRVRVLRFVSELLAASGRMALTNYLSQSLLCAFVFYGFGFGMFGQFDHAQVFALAVLIGVLQIIFSNIYLRYFRHGPAELLVRTFVDRKTLAPVRRSI